jgi:hypothetical protein
MRVAVHRILGIQPQRGFWLRCFLERTFLPAAFAASILATGAAARGQVMAPAPYHLPRLRGVFVDEKGNPIANAPVTLERDDRVLNSTKTGRDGSFAIKHISGHYRLRIKEPGYSPVNREVVVGEALTYLHSEKLYMIAGPGACTDDCTSVFTSKDKFERAIRRNTGHLN